MNGGRGSDESARSGAVARSARGGLHRHGFTRDEFIEGCRAGWTDFHSHGVVAFGPFLLDYGSGRRPDGSIGFAAGVLRFNAKGLAESHTAFVADGLG